MGGWGEGVIRYSLVDHVTYCDLALRALSYLWPIWQHATFFMSSDEGVARASFFSLIFVLFRHGCFKQLLWSQEVNLVELSDWGQTGLL